VKPRRLRDVERRIAVMDRFRFLVIWMFFCSAVVVVDVEDELPLFSFSLEGEVEDAMVVSLNDDDDDDDDDTLSCCRYPCLR